MTTQIKDIAKVENAKDGTYTIEVGNLSCTLRKLDRATYKICHSKLAASISNGKESMIDIGQIILNTCWIEGDKELKDSTSDENMEVNFAACQQAIGMIEIMSGSLKKN